MEGVMTREEMYLAYLSGEGTELPEPMTRNEEFLYNLCMSGYGAPSQEQVSTALESYLQRNPIEPGATTEEAAQIQANKDAVETIKNNDEQQDAKIQEHTTAIEQLQKNGTGTGTGTGSGGNADQSGGLSATAANLLITILRESVYSSDQSANITALVAELGVTEPEEPDEPIIPDEPEKTLTSISATYSGGNVVVGTAVTALTGIAVTAHYSDGTSETVTGYTLSGTIAEGSNTVTVSYGGMTTTFTVTGVAESGGESGNIVIATVLVDEFKYGGIGNSYPYWRNNNTNRLTYIGTAVPVTAGKTYVVTPVYSVATPDMKYGVQYADRALVDAQSTVPDDTAKIDSGWIASETYEFSPTFDGYVWITFANPSGSGDVDATKIVSVTIEEVS